MSLNPVLVQSIKQIAGLAGMAFKHGNKLPTPENGASRNLYALPFDGAWTVFNGGVTEETSHSWDVWTQRYAYDFLVLDGEGRSCRPDADPADPSSCYCHGLAVLAPADGTVVEAHDGCSDAPVALDGDVKCGGDDIRGNYVLIEHAHGEFSCLCHLAKRGRASWRRGGARTGGGTVRLVGQQFRAPPALPCAARPQLLRLARHSRSLRGRCC